MTLCGTMGCRHTFEGQDYKDAEQGGFGWIDMGKRERKTHNYNVDVNLKAFRAGMYWSELNFEYLFTTVRQFIKCWLARA